MKLGWTHNWPQLALIAFLSFIATIANFILRSYEAVTVGIVAGIVFLIIGIAMFTLNKVFKPPLT